MEELGGLGTEGTAENDGFHHHQRALAAQLGQRGSHLTGDVAAADQDYPLAGRVLSDGVAVAKRAQIVDALQLGAGHVEAPDVGAGGQQRLTKAHLLLV